MAFTSLTSDPPMPTAHPNIIYIVPHDLGRHLGCYGALVPSPHMDAFARQGVKFTQAYCSAAACSPSRACAMTGQYSHVNGEIGLAHMGWALSHDVRTVVDEFNDNGYLTVHAGVSHERHPTENHYQHDMEEHWDDYDTARAVDRAIGFLREHQDKEQPFYLNIGTQEVHGVRWMRQYPDFYPAMQEHKDAYLPHDCPDEPFFREMFARQQGAIRYFDDHMGRFFRALDELGYRENTWVIFTTDHGLACHSGRRKGRLYDPGMEISLLVRPPEGDAFCADTNLVGQSCDSLIANIDFAPTVLDLAGIPVPERMNGRSFAPFLRGQDYKPSEALFLERNFHGERPDPKMEGYTDLYDPTRSIRTRDFHLIRYFAPGVRPLPPKPWEWDHREGTESRNEFHPVPTEARPDQELFHTRFDPLEFFDVAGRAEFRDIQADLEARLHQWMEATDDHVLRGEVPTRPHEPGWGPWENLK